MSRAVRWLVLGAAALALTSCSIGEAGTPRAADPDVVESGETSSGREGSPLDGMEPCELLSDDERAELGVTEGEEADFGDSPGCDWSSREEWGILIGLSLDVGADEANVDGATPVPVSVGSHEGYRVEEQNGFAGSCAVLVVTSESSFVDISSSGGADTEEACVRATDVARIVEPKLP